MPKSKAVLLSEIKAFLEHADPAYSLVIDKAKAMIQPEFQYHLETLANLGETSESFWEYYERDENCRQAVEMIFKFSAENFEKLAQKFKELIA